MPIEPHASTPSSRVRRPPVRRHRRTVLRMASSLALSATVLLFTTVPGASADLSRTSASVPTAAGLSARVDSVLGGAAPQSDARRGNTPVELGLRFSARVDGVIAGLRVYRPVGQTPAQSATLWTAGGTRLAEVTVRASSAPGWVFAALGTPVRVRAGTVYVASYHAAAGHVSEVDYFSTGARPHGLVHPALIGTRVDPRNGVYRYGATTSFPTQTVGSTNYWVDVAFVAHADPPTPTPTSTTVPTTPSPSCGPGQLNQPFCTFPPSPSTTGPTTSSEPTPTSEHTDSSTPTHTPGPSETRIP